MHTGTIWVQFFVSLHVLLHYRTRYTCHRLRDGIPVFSLPFTSPVAKCYAPIAKVSVLEGLLGRIVTRSRHALGSLSSFFYQTTENNPTFNGVIACITHGSVHLGYKRKEN
jgi:hypothetical protein